MEEFDGGRKAFSLRGHSFVIENKQVGFFRFGLLNVLTISNAEIDIYLQSGQSQTLQGAHQRQENAVESDERTDTESRNFNTLNLSGQLGALTRKRIAGLDLRPVRMRIYDEKGVCSTVQSEYATLELNEHSLFFNGNVHVNSGQRQLTSEKLHFISGNLTFRVDGLFALQTPDAIVKGKKLETNLFLEPAVKPVAKEGHRGQSASTNKQE